MFGYLRQILFQISHDVLKILAVIIWKFVFNITYNDKLVHKTSQTVFDNWACNSGLCAGSLDNVAFLINRTVVTTCLDTVCYRLCRILVELED